MNIDGECEREDFERDSIVFIELYISGVGKCKLIGRCVEE